LFVGTPLGIALRNTKLSKAVLDGLKPQECKQGSRRIKSPIPFFPEKDELQEAVERTATIKLTLPSTNQGGAPSVCVVLQHSEKLIIHIQQAIIAIKAKGLQENYKKLARAKKECMEKLKEAVLNHDLADGDVRDDSPLAKAVRTATEAQAKAKSAVEHITSQIFQLCSNFLLEEARQL